MPQARNPDVSTLDEESVWDACGKEPLQAERGQGSCSESSQAAESSVEPGLLSKGLTQKTEIN